MKRLDLEKDTLPEGHKISEEMATAEVLVFVNRKKFKHLTSEEVVEQYPELIQAVQLGLLDITEERPKYTLKNKIMATDGDTVMLDEIIFKTRILAKDQRSIASGVDLKKDGLLYVHKCNAFLIGQHLSMLDNFEEFDLDVIEKICQLFT